MSLYEKLGDVTFANIVERAVSGVVLGMFETGVEHPFSLTFLALHPSNMLSHPA